MALPKAFDERIRIQLGDEYEDYIKCFDSDMYHGIRVNTSKISVEDFLKISPFELEPVPWTKNGFYYDHRKYTPSKHPYYYAGLYYIQEPSAMSAAALLAPKPGMRVLDLCAAPGGKSTQLATYLGDSGLLVSNEINTQRSRILSQNIERMGIKNAIVTNEDSFVLASHFPGFFNAIQVDAPCSGEGMFRKLPEAIEQWSMENVAICAARQKEILDNAAVMLKPGGTIVYSTCTFSKEENENVIEYFLERHPDFTLEEMERFWPHKVDGEGHFVAKLVRRGSVNELGADYDLCEDSCNKVEDTGLKADRKTKKNKNSKNRKNETKPALTKENMKLLTEFLDETISEDMAAWIKNSRLVMFGEQLYRLPDMEVDIKGLKVQRAGLHIGEFKKQRFEPSHSLALALKLSEAKNVVKLTWDDPQTTGFFNGQSVMLSDEQTAECKKGWALVCVDGYTAGWGKVNGTQVKNHYPKGLRNKI